MPVYGYILIGVALLLFLLLISKIKVFLSYDESLRIYAQFLFFKISIIPSGSKKKKGNKKKAANKAVAKKNDDKKAVSNDTKPKEKSIVQGLFEIRESLLTLIKRFLGKLHFKFIVLKVKVAANNAATTALLYGAVNQGVSYLLETLKSISNVDMTDNSDISVSADFLSQKSDFKAKIVLYLHFASLVYVGIHAMITYFKLKSTKEDKHGTDKAE
ncbi:MAG: hypothetical protein IJ039_09795 [Clostridia bacterium]|nr:hypothetical protein [Clostridia bacterium]